VTGSNRTIVGLKLLLRHDFDDEILTAAIAPLWD